MCRNNDVLLQHKLTINLALSAAKQQAEKDQFRALIEVAWIRGPIFGNCLMAGLSSLLLTPALYREGAPVSGCAGGLLAPQRPPALPLPMPWLQQSSP